jgi:hypothetical protein
MDGAGECAVAPDQFKDGKPVLVVPTAVTTKGSDA